MIIIGERVNATRKEISKAISEKDKKFIQKESLDQVNAGANMLDVNCGTSANEEIANIEWLVKTVQEVTDVRLVIDSPNPLVLEKGLRVCKSKAMINSITDEQDRIDKILPLVKKFNTSVIALTMDEKGMPKTAQQRFDIAKNILEAMNKYEIPYEDVYFDSLVRPISTEPEQGIEFLKSVKLIKTLPKVMTVCGLSNISFGLPNRSLINSTFLTMCVFSGLDAAIIDPTDENMISVLTASKSLLGKDEYCMEYIAAYREKKL